jgi:hypothetical protein
VNEHANKAGLDKSAWGRTKVIAEQRCTCVVLGHSTSISHIQTGHPRRFQIGFHSWTEQTTLCLESCAHLEVKAATNC